MSELSTLEEVFTENTDFYKKFFDKYATNGVSFYADSDNTGYAEFEIKVDFGYTLHVEVDNASDMTITAYRKIRDDSWDEPAEYEEHEFYNEYGLDDLEETLKNVINKFTY